jgi:hypothetical protein
LNLLDVTLEKNRDLFDAASEREGTIQVEQVFFRPRLLTVVFGPYTSEIPRYFPDGYFPDGYFPDGARRHERYSEVCTSVAIQRAGPMRVPRYKDLTLA